MTKLNQYRTEHPKCEITGCTNFAGPTPHHIKTRGSGGDDKKQNLLSLCLKHHSEVHLIGRMTFAKKYNVKKILKFLVASTRWASGG